MSEKLRSSSYVTAVNHLPPKIIKGRRYWCRDCDGYFAKIVCETGEVESYKHAHFKPDHVWVEAPTESEARP